MSDARESTVAIDDTPTEFAQFRGAVIKAVLESYVATFEEVEVLVDDELDTMLDIFETGSVDEAATVLAVINDLEDK